MTTTLYPHGDGALATTTGPLVDEPDAGSLGASSRADIARWRDRCWNALEQRVDASATRDPAAPGDPASMRDPAPTRDPARWYERIVRERWREERGTRALPPFALELFYAVRRFIPRSLQLGLRRRLIARQGLPAFPLWPFDPAGAELMGIAFADALLARGTDAVRFPWFWPDGAQAAVTLTHDVESADGLARAATVAGWEEQRGFRSSFNIVSDWYPIDTEQVAELSKRGHEIGSHAIHHDRSLFASRGSFERQLPLLAAAAERLGAVGFRSPATHRVVEWLGELPFSYDCTMPHSDPFEPIPGGTATVWPFFHGRVVELPYTAPQDHTLFNLLGHTDASLWQGQLERVVSCNGLFQSLTHPDEEYLGRPTIGAAYRDLLDTIARRDDLWVALPRDIADWWRRRAQGLTPREDGVARWTGSGIELAPVRPSSPSPPSSFTASPPSHSRPARVTERAVARVSPSTRPVP